MIHILFYFLSFCAGYILCAILASGKIDDLYRENEELRGENE